MRGLCNCMSESLEKKIGYFFLFNLAISKEGLYKLKFELFLSKVPQEPAADASGFWQNVSVTFFKPSIRKRFLGDCR